MNQNSNLTKIKCLMEHATANTDLCIMVYRLITASVSKDEQLEMFKFFMKNVMKTDSDNSMDIPSLIEIDEIIKLSKNSIGHLKNFIDDLYKKQVSEEEFYMKLWEFISTDYHFNSDIAKGVALFNCLKLKKVPYVNLDFTKALKMENEEFGALMDEVLDSKYMDKVKKVEAFGFEQKTEKMSMLLNIIESCHDEKMKVLLFMIIVCGQVKREKLEDLMRARVLGLDDD